MSGIMSTFFTRFLAVFLGLVAMLTGGNMSNINIEIKGEVTTQSESIVVEVFNYTGKSITMDEYFTLEVNQDGEWVEVEQTGAVKDIARTVGSVRSASMTINIVEVFGEKLDAGEYKLTKTYSGDNSCFVIFNVVEA